MRERLRQIINNEDKKNPFTDEELAKQLFLNRSEVTQLRQSADLPDSRERRKPLLVKEIKVILANFSGISERALTTEIKKRGFNISRYSVSKIVNEMDLERLKPSERQAEERKEETKTPQQADPFATMIGWNKSLRVKVEQAKAAVLYPPNGLHTLIVGLTGVGKSEMAESMYKFALQAKNVTAEEFPFVIFNCADYAENPQLLLAQLFGYKKGAFTGAEADKDGLVSKADGGILFLDEVHRLPPDGQEILFQLIDKGKYRRLGETSSTLTAKIMIIAATTENIETSLLGTFRRRIPMIIELPTLSTRPAEERSEIIKMFFQKEAARINKTIAVTYNALKALSVYDCVGNIGQLRSDIQVACARGFLTYVAEGNKNEGIFVDIGALPAHVSKGMLNATWNRSEIEKYIRDDLVFYPDTVDVVANAKDSLYNFPDEIYKNIEEDYQKLQGQGLSNEVINKIIGDDLEAKVRNMIRQVKKNKNKFIKEDLKLIVGTKIVELVQEMIKIAVAGLSEIDDTLFYCLATHLNASVERIKSGKTIINPKLDYVKKNYRKEFEIALEMASLTNYYLGIELPEDEVGFIAMYLKTLAKKDVNSQETIGLIIISHGHVAEGMAFVANRLLGVNLIKTVEMALDEKPEDALDRTLEAVVKADRGKGVLLLVDMGSLLGFGQQITQRTGIKTRTVTRVDTLMVIEAVRKVLLPDSDLDDVADSLIKEKSTGTVTLGEAKPYNSSEIGVISLCLTGEGTAKLIQKKIAPEIKKINEKIKIITLGVLDENDILEQIEKIRRNMGVLAIIGTVNPHHPEVPFVSATDILKGTGITKLRQIIKAKYNLVKGGIVVSEKNISLFRRELIILKSEVKDKQEAFVLMADLLTKKGYVTEKFIQGVREREALATTALGNSLAIPHGYSEDIILPAIGVLILKKPIVWGEETPVSIIFMLALNEASKHEFQRIYKMIYNQEIIEMMKKAKKVEDVLSLLKGFKDKE
ncbi:MAG: sigma 54-interacting transcriptional regulator [Clostridia bacterium]|nr:sigma 54-interacting transcriptional regulator [Clostridia bacterium]